MDLNCLAPCGIDCVNCELYGRNSTDEYIAAVASRLGRDPESLRCKGCREQGGCSFFSGCETLACVTRKGFAFCSECPDFPCPRLQPASDRADKIPHNYKVYNLCRIAKVGPEAFLEEAPLIRKRYYEGKMRIGAGPQLR